MSPCVNKKINLAPLRPPAGGIILWPGIFCEAGVYKINNDIITFTGEKQPRPDEARAAIIPVPLESTVSYGRGTSLGPAAIMQASSQIEFYDQELEMETIRLGILTLPRVDVAGDIQLVLDRVEQAVSEQLAEGRLPVVLGGEHTVTLGALRAMVKHYGSDFTVLVLDAHLDLREEYEGTKFSHACVMKRALDLGLKVRHLGARSCSLEEAQLVSKRKMSPIWASEVHNQANWIEKSLTDVTGPVYVSLDIDGLDPSCMPATGTPEPGGLSWYQVNDWLIEVCRRYQILGLDLVELAPISGQHAWDFTAARLLYRAMGLALRAAPRP